MHFDDGFCTTIRWFGQQRMTRQSVHSSDITNVFEFLHCIHRIVYIVNIVLHTLHCLHFIECIALYTFNWMHCIHHIVYIALYTLHCIHCFAYVALYTLHCIQFYCINCIVYIVLYTSHYIHCIVCITLYTLHYIHSLCTLHWMHVTYEVFSSFEPLKRVSRRFFCMDHEWIYICKSSATFSHDNGRLSWILS